MSEAVLKAGTLVRKQPALQNTGTGRKKKESRFSKPRTPVRKRKLPTYTRNEETFNMVTHIVGAGIGLLAMVAVIVKCILAHNLLGLISGVLYCLSMVLVYTISSVYHGLDPVKARYAKKIMQILDHCDIYTLICGTYTPIALGALREAYPALAWSTLAIVYVVCMVGTVFTAIDFHKYGPISYACYFVAGWSVLSAIWAMWMTYSPWFVLLFLGGGIVYTLGMIFFVRQTKGYKYSHSIFHLFILGGSLLQLAAVFFYCL